TGAGSDAINDMGRITGYSPLAATGFVLAILALFVCQFFVLTATAPAALASLGTRNHAEQRQRQLLERLVVLLPLAFAAILIWMQAVTTTDLYGYVARGYLFTHLHLNPMVSGATALPGGLSVDRPPSPYGPAWLLIAGAVALVSGENLLLNLLLFKVIAFLGVAAALWLVNDLARSLYPERRLRIIALFGWSPLLLFEAVGNGHNDIIMMACALF